MKMNHKKLSKTASKYCLYFIFQKPSTKIPVNTWMIPSPKASPRKINGPWPDAGLINCHLNCLAMAPVSGLIISFIRKSGACSGVRPSHPPKNIPATKVNKPPYMMRRMSFWFSRGILRNLMAARVPKKRIKP